MALTTDDYLIKLGSSTKIPNRYIDKDSYNADTERVVANRFTNANGASFEKYYPNERLKVSFSTSNLTKNDWDTIIGYFNSNMITNTDDVMVTAWVPKRGQYVYQRCKVSGLAPTLHKESYRYDGIYNPVKIMLTGYARSE
ncbi:MAG: hypothetical protein J5811_02550 [Lachnospiraceae bacterium]|nr:hypothetical protein [Lachnospiraceae bacterium]